jgi:hypothetical protein
MWFALLASHAMASDNLRLSDVCVAVPSTCVGVADHCMCCKKHVCLLDVLGRIVCVVEL